MNLVDLTDLTDNPDFIEGIYNYCDRWCERCPLTARWANVKIVEAQSPTARAFVCLGIDTGDLPLPAAVA